MIFPAEWPLESVCAELCGLYVALNSPVVRQAPLPVGPASAAVAFHGPAGVSLAIRSVRTGQVAFFTSDPEAQPAAGMALDAALSFAETLGFVFDENEVGPNGSGGAEAARLWCELIGEEYPASPPPEASVPEGTEPSDDAAIRTIVAASEAPLRDPSEVLSKFRWSAGPGRADAHRPERETA